MENKKKFFFEKNDIQDNDLISLEKMIEIVGGNQEGIAYNRITYSRNGYSKNVNLDYSRTIYAESTRPR